MENSRAPLNRTLTLSEDELIHYKTLLRGLETPATAEEIRDRLLCGDILAVLPNLPDRESCRARLERHDFDMEDVGPCL